MKKYALLFVISFAVSFSYSVEPDLTRNPCGQLIVSTSDSFIHLFKNKRSYITTPSLVNFIGVSYTSKKTGQMKWLVMTGSYSNPTVRRTYSVTRLCRFSTRSKSINCCDLLQRALGT